jgi:hypothetical protein
MHPLSSRPTLSFSPARLVLAVILLAAACLGPIPPAAAQAAAGQAAQPNGESVFARYGFTASGFTPAQAQLILDTLDAYAEALGGPEKLREIIVTYNHGKNRPIVYEPGITGANTDVQLSPTVFDMRKAAAQGFSMYAAQDEAAHARIVIGHEIAHLLLFAAWKQTGVDWAGRYRQQVRRYWKAIPDARAPEEEAVTQLSLAVLEQGYAFSLKADRPETDPYRLAEIERWAADFLYSWR